MFRLTLAQMRRSAGRLTAAGIAIAIGTAFVAITLLAGNVVGTTTTSSFAARYTGSDLIVGRTDGALSTADVDALAQVDGVAAAEGETIFWTQLEAGDRRSVIAVIPVGEPGLLPVQLSEGVLPTASGEVAFPANVAERLGIAVGDTVTHLHSVLDESDGEHTMQEATEPLTVVGLTTDRFGAFTAEGGVLVAPQADVARWESDVTGTGFDSGFTAARVLLDDASPATAGTITAALAEALDISPSVVQVLTPDEVADARMASVQGGQNVVMVVFVFVFAAIALLVAALVIANTFQVLVAQRLRTLALLRCVGASKGQLRASVLLEAALLGLLSSVAGVLLGMGLVQVALTVAQGMDVGAPLPTAIQVTANVVWVPLLVGTLVTVVASLAPAALATRVAPLAALRPLDAPTLGKRAGKLRLVISVLLTAGGFGLLALGLWLGTAMREATLGLLAGVLGGAASFVGVLVGAVFWMPWVVALAGRIAGLTGPTARLAAANTLRNPRRTSATATALLIGVTLVAMFSTGAASARATVEAELDGSFPVDVVVSTDGISIGEDGRTTELSPAVRRAVCALDGVAACAESSLTDVSLSSSANAGISAQVRGIDADDAAAVLHTRAAVAPLAPGTVVVPEVWADHREIVDGEQITLAGPDGEATFTAAVTPMTASTLLLVPSDAARLEADAPVVSLWVTLDDIREASTVVPHIHDVVSGYDTPARVTGSAEERAEIGQVIDTLLAVVLGLLAAAVVIALIGVANTLSLSVIERQKESATLRAIGLTKGRLRGMLAIEGTLIALVGAVLGVALGLAYGWLGTATALSLMANTVLAVPWQQIALVLLIAVAAGLLASVLPGRTAARTSPVEALAAD